MSAPKTKAEAEAQGFIVDTYCYPWFAYKGARFAPDERVFGILTDKEAELTALRDELVAALEFWTHDGRLQTFEDRERFRKEARALIARVKGEPA